MARPPQLDLFGTARVAEPEQVETVVEAPAMPGVLKVATWNVNGIRARHEQVLGWIEQEAPDVVCLQEIKAPADKVPAPLVEGLAGYRAHWHGFKGYSGVALLVRRARFGDEVEFTHPPLDMEQRIVVAAHADLVFASVYVPNGGKDYRAKLRFLDEMIAWAAALHAEGRHLVLCGDFNVAHTDRDVHPDERKAGIGQLPEERRRIDQLLARGGLVDVGRKVAPDDDRLFTWWAPWRNLRQRNIGWRLDYVAASAALVDEHTHCVAYREVGTSDHGPVIAWLRDRPATATDQRSTTTA
jgi:exodeoxyribonuclease-3